MSTSKRRRRSLEVKPGWRLAKVQVRDHEFYLRVPVDGITEVWPISTDPDDAWNYDICADMLVYVQKARGRYFVRARVEQNKKFVHAK